MHKFLTIKLRYDPRSKAFEINLNISLGVILAFILKLYHSNKLYAILEHILAYLTNIPF